MARRTPVKDSTLRTYLTDTGELPTDAVIGYIVMFTINDTPIKRETLEQQFATIGLNPDLLPPEINPLDAFKKATAEAKDTYPLLGNTAKVLCREVDADKDTVVRQITREIQDRSQRVLTYDKVIDCVFYRPTTSGGKVTKGSERVRIQKAATGPTPEEQADVQRIAMEIQERYTRYYQHLDGNKLRGVIRNYLGFLNSIPLRDAVYFVHSSRTDELAKLRTLVDGFGNGCFMQAFPLVDLPNERKMVVDAFQREASQKLTDIVADIHKLKSTRQQITASAYAKVKERYDTVMSQAQEYLRTLDITQDTTASAAEIALDAIYDLQKRLLDQESA